MLINRKSQGFSLIELMIGIAIVTLLFGFAARNFGTWMQNQQIRTGAESILNGMQLARGEAVKNNNLVRFRLCGLPLASWEVLAVSATAPAPVASLSCGAGSDAVALEERVQEHSGLEGSRLATVAVTPAGATTITFDGLGRVVANTNGSGIIAVVDINSTSAAADRPLRVTVGVGGNMRMCDPSPLLVATDSRAC